MLVKRLALLIGLIGVVSVSSAATVIPTGPYVEANAGISFVGDGEPSSRSLEFHTVKGTRSGFGFSTNVGYQFTQYLGAEIGVSSYGTQKFKSEDTPSLKAKSKRDWMIDAALRLTAPLPHNFDVFAKVGPSIMFHKVSLSNEAKAVDPTMKTSATGYGFIYGLGVEYNMTRHIAFNTQFTGGAPVIRFSSTDDRNHPMIASMYLVSAGLKFTL